MPSHKSKKPKVIFQTGKVYEPPAPTLRRTRGRPRIPINTTSSKIAPPTNLPADFPASGNLVFGGRGRSRGRERGRGFSSEHSSIDPSGASRGRPRIPTNTTGSKTAPPTNIPADFPPGGNLMFRQSLGRGSGTGAFQTNQSGASRVGRSAGNFGGLGGRGSGVSGRGRGRGRGQFASGSASFQGFALARGRGRGASSPHFGMESPDFRMEPNPNRSVTSNVVLVASNPDPSSAPTSKTKAAKVPTKRKRSGSGSGSGGKGKRATAADWFNDNSSADSWGEDDQERDTRGPDDRLEIKGYVPTTRDGDTQIITIYSEGNDKLIFDPSEADKGLQIVHASDVGESDKGHSHDSLAGKQVVTVFGEGNDKLVFDPSTPEKKLQFIRVSSQQNTASKNDPKLSKEDTNKKIFEEIHPLFDHIHQGLLKGIIANTFNPTDLLWLNIIPSPATTKDGLAKNELGYPSNYGHNPEIWSNGFAAYKSIMNRIHGTNSPNLELTMEIFRASNCDFAKSHDWQKIVLPALMAFMKDVIKNDPMDATKWQFKEFMWYLDRQPRRVLGGCGG